MTKQNLTDITIILDASSSMLPDSERTRSAINEFILGQKNTEGDCNISLVTFSANDSYVKEWYRQVWNGLNIKEISELSKDNYKPFGNTALFDATKKTIEETGQRLSKLQENERPSKVLMVIMTDGEENSSKTSLNELKEKIFHQENKYAWNFLFLGADFSTKKQTEALGLDADRSYDYCKSKSVESWKGLSRAVSDYRETKENKLYSNFADTAKKYAAQE